MNENEIYQNLGKLLWSIMAEDVGVIFCEGYIYPDSSSYSFEWLTKNNKMGWFDFDQIPHEIGDKVIHLMENLIKLDVFKEKWTQFKISLTDSGKFNIDFAYIPIEDRWPGLYMKAVSDLKEDELDEYNIPVEAWKECVKRRRENK